MTTRKRLLIAVWIVLIAIAGLAGISYLHIFHTRISWSDSRVFAVTISDGHVWIIHHSAELNMSYVQDSPLAEYADHWTSDPTKTFTWYRNHHVNFRETPINYLGIGCSLFVPLAIMLALLLIEWAVRQRRQLAGTIREIIRPSDRFTVGPFRRVIRRVVVVFFGLATILAGGTWIVSYMLLSKKYTRQFELGSWHVFRPGGGGRGVTIEFQRGRPYVDPRLLILVDEGRVTVSYLSRIAKGTIVPTRGFGMAGFRYWSRVSLPIGGRGGPPQWP